MHLHRECYLSHLFRQDSDREIFVELFGPLVGLEGEWRDQGASPDELSLDAFDFDSVEVCHVGVTHPLGNVAPQVLEDTPEFRVEIDHLGRRTRIIKGSSTISLPETFPLEDPEDWPRIRSWLQDDPARTHQDDLDRARRQREKGALVMVSMPGGYDLPRQLMGDEEACIAFIEEPDLIHDILQTTGKMLSLVIERIASVCPIDVLHIHEDFAGKSGPLIGPNQIREFLHPYYQKAWADAQAAGARVFSLDSDGNIEPVIVPLMEAGVNQMYPMEPAAGMDIVQVRREFPDLILKGGIDKHVLRQGECAIRNELEYKLQPEMQGGGVVFGLDHRIPNGTPLEAYRFYVKTARELLGLPAAEARLGSWQRMAF